MRSWRLTLATQGRRAGQDRFEGRLMQDTLKNAQRVLLEEQHFVRGAIVGIAGEVLITMILLASNGVNGPLKASTALLFVIPVIVAAAIGGRYAGIIAVIPASIIRNEYFRVIHFTILELAIQIAVF